MRKSLFFVLFGVIALAVASFAGVIDSETSSAGPGLGFESAPGIPDGGAAIKVKIAVARANIRSAAAASADVVMVAESGQTFDVIEKVGDWYQIALPGGQKGFVSSVVVEEIADAPKPQIAQPQPVSPRPAPQPEPGGGASSNLEIGLFGGLAMTSVKGTTQYADTWNYYWLTNVNESETITGTSKSGMYFGATGSYFFSPSLGVQLSAGYLKSDVPTAADFTMAWTWSSQVGGGGDNQSASWTGPGSLSVMPISVNIVAKFGSGSLDAYVSGGPTLFSNSFNASTNVGYGVSWTQFSGSTLTQQWVDAIPVAADIPKTSWTAFGGNAGAGLGFKLSPSLALVVEARYFLCPKKDLAWMPATGTYDGIFYTTIKGWDFNAGDAESAAGNMTTFQVNPSFLLIAAGIKISI
jgi:hypothetical protein